MKNLSLANRYATAAYVEAKSTKDFNKFKDDAAFVLEILRSDTDFGKLLQAVAISNDDKISIIKCVCSTYSLGRSIEGLLVVMVRNERVHQVESVLEMIQQKFYEDMGQVVVDIIYAGKLDDDERNDIKLKLQQITGKDIVLNEQHDPSLLCGVKVVVGNTMYDMSAKSKLKALKSQLLR